MGNVTLEKLFPQLDFAAETAHKAVLDLTLDSRKAKPGTVFFALKGHHVNREKYIDEVFAAGAVAVVKDGDVDGVNVEESGRIIISLASLKAQVGVVAARFFDFPSKKMQVVGVTGTNGKTSCADLLAQLWRLKGLCAASLGTLGWSLENGQYVSTGLTTLDAVENQRTLRFFCDRDVTHVVMEVSSHGIDQHRIAGIEFDAKALTNISRDHLDYHGTMDNYAATKLSFVADSEAVSIINVDDAEIASRLSQVVDAKRYTFTLAENKAKVKVKDPNFFPEGIEARVCGVFGEFELKSQLVGRFSLYNLVVVSLSYLATVDAAKLSELVDFIPKLLPVSGRLERVAGEKIVFIDYAHTPDALENVLIALRSHSKEKIVLVFGCGGDRDRGKRPEMARIAERYADRIFVTSDNPRSESPESIANDIVAGFQSERSVVVELDRRKAIQGSIAQAGDQDIILIAGKGHENYQEISGTKYPFSDYDEVKRLIA